MNATVEPSNFYWFNSPVENITEYLPRNQKITTHLPANVALIRIAATAVFTAYLVAKIGATVWAWPIVVVATGFGIYTAVKHIFIKDPLVEAMYKIAGNCHEYNKLPVWNVIKNKKLSQTISEIQWKNLDHPLYRALTSDGRKVLIVKGYDSKEKSEDSPSSRTEAVMIFVEKLGAYDVPRIISNVGEGFESILDAIPLVWPLNLENRYSRTLEWGFEPNGAHINHRIKTMNGSISSELVNELMQQSKGCPVRAANY